VRRHPSCGVKNRRHTWRLKQLCFNVAGQVYAVTKHRTEIRGAALPLVWQMWRRAKQLYRSVKVKFYNSTISKG
jgi:hypothetical protein